MLGFVTLQPIKLLLSRLELINVAVNSRYSTREVIVYFLLFTGPQPQSYLHSAPPPPAPGSPTPKQLQNGSLKNGHAVPVLNGHHPPFPPVIPPLSSRLLPSFFKNSLPPPPNLQLHNGGTHNKVRFRCIALASVAYRPPACILCQGIVPKNSKHLFLYN